MNWPWHRKSRGWEIYPQDIHLNPFSLDISFIVREGWQPFGVSSVPNTTDPNQLRIWTRRRERTYKNTVYEIKIASAGWGGHQVLLHLTDHWEPFGVSDSFGNPIIWFRRRVT